MFFAIIFLQANQLNLYCKSNVWNIYTIFHQLFCNLVDFYKYHNEMCNLNNCLHNKSSRLFLVCSALLFLGNMNIFCNVVKGCVQDKSAKIKAEYLLQQEKFANLFQFFFSYFNHISSLRQKWT